VSEYGVVKLGTLIGRDQRLIKLIESADSKLITIGSESAEEDWPLMCVQ